MDAPWHPWVNKQPLNQADGVRRLHEPPQDGAGAQIKHSGSSDFTPRHFFNPLAFHGCIYGNSLFIRPLVLLYMQTPPWDLIICIPLATSEDTEVRSSAKLMGGHDMEMSLCYICMFYRTLILRFVYQSWVSSVYQWSAYIPDIRSCFQGHLKAKHGRFFSATERNVTRHNDCLIPSVSLYLFVSAKSPEC